MYPICRVLFDNNKKIYFSSAINSGSTLEEIIEDDARYGKMIPANGQYFTYKIADWQGKTITNRQTKSGVKLVWSDIKKRLNFDAKEVTEGYADFKIYFRRTIDDPQLTKNTIMYHFFPINEIHSEYRGVCVVNTDFNFSMDGEPVDMSVLDPEHYPKPGVAAGPTIDFDQVYRHEVGHGLGLPHSPKTEKVMSYRYDLMVEYFEDETDDETMKRLIAKYGEKSTWSKFKERWIQFIRVRLDNY